MQRFDLLGALPADRSTTVLQASAGTGGDPATDIRARTSRRRTCGRGAKTLDWTP